MRKVVASIVHIGARIISLFLKLLCWEAFTEADETSVTTLANLCVGSSSLLSSKDRVPKDHKIIQVN